MANEDLQFPKGNPGEVEGTDPGAVIVQVPVAALPAPVASVYGAVMGLPSPTETMTLGERRLITGAYFAVGETNFTISTTTGATVTIYDAAGGLIASGLTRANVTGFEGAAGVFARVWFLLDTATLVAGYYLAVFSTVITDGAGQSEAVLCEVPLHIRAII